MSLPIRSRVLGGALPRADVLLVFARGPRELPLPRSLARRAEAHLVRSQFRGGGGESHAVPLAGTSARDLFVIGTGKEFTLDIFRRGVAAGVRYTKAEGYRRLAILLPGIGPAAGRSRYVTLSASPVDVGRAFAEGALLANYRFTTYAPEAAERERRRKLEAVDLLVPRAAQRDVSGGIRRGSIDVLGTVLARDLVNEPASRMTPSALADQARTIAKASKGSLTLTLLDRKQCEARGMGAFLAVARGSAQPPVFIHLTYKPGTGHPTSPRLRGASGAVSSRGGRQDALPRVVLIGKGITFDSGGLSLKPAEGMETMKIDMAGAAAVLGVFSVLLKLKVPVEVHGMIAACENMPSGTAVKPGDIVRSLSGKTIEILNTDAEGRLTLADVLGEAVKLKPTAIIDLATLTGACVVALGEDVAGLFSNRDDLAMAVGAAAATAGEPVWRLPLVREYRDQLKSEVADLKNIIGKRWGAAITAALFLEEFVDDVPWAHLDLAGPSYAERQTNPVNPVGGTGFGVRTLLRYLEKLGSRE